MPARRFQPIGGDLSRVDCHLKRGPLTGRSGLARVRKPRQTSLVTTSESKSLSQLPCQPCESTNPHYPSHGNFQILLLIYIFLSSSLLIYPLSHSRSPPFIRSASESEYRKTLCLERDRPIMMTSSRSAFIPGPQCPSFTSTGLGPSR